MLKESAKSIGVLLIDDHPAIRLGLRLMLAHDPLISVVGEADSGFAAVEQAQTTNPDVILLDVRMPGASGIDVIRRLRQVCPETRIVILSAYEEEEYITRAIEAGAHAYLLKSASKSDLISAIYAVARGERLLASSWVCKVLERFETLLKEKVKLETGLSSQDMEILRLLAAGASNKDIASQIFVSEITVIRRVQEIVSKLGVTNRAHAVAEAIRRGLI